MHPESLTLHEGFHLDLQQSVNADFQSLLCLNDGQEDRASKSCQKVR